MDTEVRNYSHRNGEKVGIVAIGVGDRLRGLLNLLFKYHKDLVELKAICDTSPEAIKNTQQFPWAKDAATFGDFREMLQQVSGVEWVLIGSKNYEHKDHCVAAFSAGKNVFCEKPLATTLEDCREILEAHKQSGKLFSTGFVLRHAPMYVKLKELIDSGTLGRIISVEANEILSPSHGGYIMRNWRRFKEQAGPHILEKCCHDIDILNWLIGSVPTRVASFGGTNIFVPENRPEDESTRLLYEKWPQAWEDVDPFLSEKNIADNQVIIMEYRNGVKVSFHTNSSGAFAQRRILLCGLKGTVEANLITGKIHYQTISNYYENEELDVGATGTHGGGDKIIVQDLADSMDKGTLPKASGMEGLLSAIVCLAVEEAMIKGTVVDLESYWKEFNINM